MIEPLVLTREFALKWRFGLRSALLVHRVAVRYSASIELSWNRERADAKNLISLACLRAAAVPDLGQRLAVSASGADAEAALVALAELFESGEPAPACAHPGCAAAPLLTDLTPRALEYSCANLHLWTVERRTGRVVVS